ncbi:hypothetical protein [Bosea sp. TAB14]|uniref:hypothetical protein n=1 Tax=Bosea sp. TAB14 TaxID=3237481 RepID=UPI003F91A64C
MLKLDSRDCKSGRSLALSAANAKVQPVFFFFFPPIDEARTQQARNMLKAAREVMPDVSIATLASFLEVALSSGDQPSAKTLAERAGIPYARFMRHVDVLAEGTRRVPGHKVLSKTYNDALRRHEIQMTGKGLSLLDAINAPLRENTDQRRRVIRSGETADR